MFQSTRFAPAIEPPTDKALAHQYVVAEQQQREGCPQHPSELDSPRPLHPRHRDLQRHHQRQVGDVDPVRSIGEEPVPEAADESAVAEPQDALPAIAG